MIRTKKPKPEIIIDLTGPDGNAFVLMGMAVTSPDSSVRTGRQSERK
jgi:hypothetical protein